MQVEMLMLAGSITFIAWALLYHFNEILFWSALGLFGAAGTVRVHNYLNQTVKVEQGAAPTSRQRVALLVKHYVNSVVTVVGPPVERVANSVVATQTGQVCLRMWQRIKSYIPLRFLAASVLGAAPRVNAAVPGNREGVAVNIAEESGRFGAQAADSFIHNVMQAPHVREVIDSLRQAVGDGRPLGEAVKKMAEPIAEEIGKGLEEAETKMEQKAAAVKGEFKGAIFWGTTLLVGAMGAWFLLKHLLAKPNQDQNKSRIRVPEFEKRPIERLRSLYTRSSHTSPELFFESSLQEHLNAVKELIISVRKKKYEETVDCSYPRVLLYGPQGTGKRSFAQSVAQAAGMSFIPVTGSAFFAFKGTDAFKAVDTLFDEIKQNTKGAVLFIEQAELLLSQPKDEQPTDDRAVFIAYFAEQIKDISKLCPIVFALEELPHPLHKISKGCITHQISFTLPTVKERLRVLKLFNTRLQESQKNVLNDQEIEALAHDLEGATYVDLQKALVGVY